MKRGFVLVVVFGLMLVTGAPLRAGGGGTQGAQLPMFPEVTLMPLTGGSPVPITSYRGHPVLINFWATWCPPCRQELPELQHLYEEYGKRGLKVAAVNVDRSAAGVAEFLKEHRLTLPVFRLDEITLRRLGVSSIPMSVLVDSTGRVAQLYRGYSPTMVRDIQRRLKKMIPDSTKGSNS